jgi:hypothetical protein
MQGSATGGAKNEYWFAPAMGRNMRTTYTVGSKFPELLVKVFTTDIGKIFVIN